MKATLCNAPEIVLTTDRAESSYGVPVLLVDGEAYGPGDVFPSLNEGPRMTAAELVRAVLDELGPEARLLADRFLASAPPPRLGTITIDDPPADLEDLEAWLKKKGVSLFTGGTSPGPPPPPAGRPLGSKKGGRR